MKAKFGIWDQSPKHTRRCHSANDIMVPTTVALSALWARTARHNWMFNIQKKHGERVQLPLSCERTERHKWTASSEPTECFVLSKYHMSRGARPPSQGCLPLSLSCRHQFCPLWLSNQLGIGKVTLTTMGAEQPLSILEVHDEIAFYNFPSKIYLVYHDPNSVSW